MSAALSQANKHDENNVASQERSPFLTWLVIQHPRVCAKKVEQVESRGVLARLSLPPGRDAGAAVEADIIAGEPFVARQATSLKRVHSCVLIVRSSYIRANVRKATRNILINRTLIALQIVDRSHTRTTHQPD
jgi:hypothetical protein